MNTVYKVVGRPFLQDDGQWIIQLTDLNSNGAFQIKTLISSINGRLLMGFITEGPKTYIGKPISIEILAGYDSHNGKAYVDASAIDNPQFKFISQLIEEDRLLDLR